MVLLASRGLSPEAEAEAEAVVVPAVVRVVVVPAPEAVAVVESLLAPEAEYPASYLLDQLPQFRHREA